jgi:hypothetical protein
MSPTAKAMWLRHDDELGLRGRFPPPDIPWTEQYGQVHNAFMAEMLDSPAVLERFAGVRRLPRDYGAGLDTRVGEYPWLRPAGRTLDTRSTLNYAHILGGLGTAESP